MACEDNFRKNKDRMVSIDILRGLSILGIFLVNMLDFHSPLLYIDPLKWWVKPLDHYTYILIDIFAQASFYPLFSMLFGFSVVLLWEKVNSRGQKFIPLMLRRLLVLLIIGVIHALFVWHGDILITYALLGFILLPFLGLTGRKLLFTGVWLYTIPALGICLLLLTIEGDGLRLFDYAALNQSLEIYSHGTFIEITKQRVTDWLSINNFENFPLLFISIFPLFLIGAGVAKLKWLENVLDKQKKLSLILLISFVSGVGLKSLPYLVNGALFAQYAQDSFGGVSLAIFYSLLIIKLAGKVKWLNQLAAVGRMSISNYLFQSLLATLIFYGYGLGFYGKVSWFGGTVLGLLIFALQILMSKLWLQHYVYGPVEWLWRSLTYKKRVKLRKFRGNI